MRILGSVLLGLLGFWLYRLQGAPSDDVIRFGLGSAPVLVAFLRLGFAPGVLAALVAYVPFFAGSAWAVAVADALQCLAAAYIYRSLGSLIGSVALYWLVVGWAVDLLLLGPAGAGPETLTLTFIRQLLSGLLSALAAEVVIRLPAVASRLAWPTAGRLQTFLFGRVAFVATLPALAIALPYTHGAHQRLLERATASRQSSARRVESALRQFFTERERDLEALAREVEAAPDVAARASRLASFHGGRPYFWVALADASDIVVASSPRLSARGVALRGRRLSPPLPLSTARVEQRTAWSGLLLDDVQSPSPGEARVALMLAMPIDGRGGLAGTLVASIDSTSLSPLVGDPHLSAEATVSLLDGRGHVVTSTDSRFRPGDQFPPAADNASPRAAVRLALEPSGFVVVVERAPGSLGGDLVNLAGQVVAFLLGALSFAFVSALGFARRASGLLRAVDHAGTGLREGHSTDPVVLRALTDSPIAEVRALAGRFADMHSAVAYQDALTGLPNRRLFLDRLGVAIAQAMRRHESLAVLFVNIDRFRAVNESLGRELGSLLLKLVAERLQGLTRSADTLACLGGDEFALLAPGSGPEAGAETAKRLLAGARQPYRVDGREVFLTFSIGVSEFPNDGHDGEALLRNAAAASSDSKDQGAQDTFRLFTPSFNRKAMERLAVEGGLRRALTNSEFRLHYQPLVEVSSGRIEGVEALIRWEQPGTGLVSPGEFIPVAESSKLIVAIGQWALPTACAQVEQWRRRGHGALTLALNLSARHLQEGNLVADVGKALADSGLAPGALELEVTESAAIRDIEKSIATLLALRGLGVRIAVDDFGTGYSSLSYLRRLPIDTVKIDRSFVGNVTNDPGDAAIATAILAMAQSLKLRVVAEGVETEEQLAFLRARACDTFQGYLFSRPLPAGELEALLAKSAPAPAHRETQP